MKFLATPHTVLLPFLILIVLLPLYRQTSFAPPNTQYSFVHGYFSDYYSYLSYIRQGAVQFHQTNQFTTENPQPTWTHVFYLILGRVGSFLNLSPITAYHGAIVVSLTIFYFFTYALIQLVIPVSYRLLALGFIFLASPIGPVGNISLFGVSLTVSSVFWTRMDLYTRHSLVPHHFASIALFIAATYFIFLYIKKKQMKWALVCAITNAVGTFFLNIPGLIFLLALIGTTFLMRVKRELLPGILLIIALGIAMHLIVFKIHTSARPTQLDQLEWEYKHHKAEVYPINFSVYLLSYGILLLFIPFSIMSIIKRKRFDCLFILLAAILPLLLYLSSVMGWITINKLRFVYSAPYVFAGLLATLGSKTIFDRLHSRVGRKLLILVIIVLLLGSNINGLRNHWFPLLLKRRIYKNVYIPKGHIQAVKFLDSYVPRYTKVLTTWSTGGFIPAFSYLRVFIGHELLTPNFWQKWDLADKFYMGKMTKDEAKKLLVENDIAYVFWDLGSPVAAYKDILSEVYTTSGVTLYKVRLES